MQHLLGLGLALLGLAACSTPEPAAATPGPDAGPFDAPAAPPIPPDPVGFRASGSLKEARALATATRLLDGRVLVVGGEREDYTMLASAITITTSWNSIVASGKVGRTTRRNPYAPTFASTPEKTAITGIGIAR